MVVGIWGQTRCPIYWSGTFNVQRSTLNFQWGDRKGVWWPGYGDRHGIWADGLLTRRTRPSAGRTVQAGCGAQRWGQTRCPIYWSGTFNVKRSALNFQRGDRKGVWWPGYGDRHGIWADGLLTQPDQTKRRSGGPSRLWRPDMGTDTMSDIQAGPDTQRWGQTRTLDDRTLDPL